MLIESPTMDRARLPGYVRLARRIVYERKRTEPEVLWFDIPEAYAESLTGVGDGWLVALLPLALRMKEPLRLDASVDAGLLRNTEALMNIWARWYSEYPAVPIEVESEHTPPPRPGAGTGLFFTGGIDSFYSLMHYDGEAERDRRPRVEDLLYIWGYDLPLDNEPAFHRKAKALTEVAARLDRRAITMATNLRQTRLATLDWAKVTHGAALGAAALMLEGRLATVLLSAALARDATESFGAHPLTDRLMSTSRTTFVHYGAEATRFEKAEFIVGSEVVRQYLHVCWEDASDRNCGRCEKCFRTQMTLDLLGCREQAPCFDIAAYSLAHADRVVLGSRATARLMEDLRAPAQARGRLDVLSAIDICLEADRRRNGTSGAARWRRRRRRWRESFQRRWLSGRASAKYWLVTLAVIGFVLFQISDCWLEPDLAAGSESPTAAPTSRASSPGPVTRPSSPAAPVSPAGGGA
ncbi:MAG TPA: hypothetical protein VMJ30_10655 [Gemmatimonadales bacterium]|nr:hypothetical protein [Gemmatimonadales bacterium]